LVTMTGQQGKPRLALWPLKTTDGVNNAPAELRSIVRVGSVLISSEVIEHFLTAVHVYPEYGAATIRTEQTCAIVLGCAVQVAGGIVGPIVDSGLFSALAVPITGMLIGSRG
jgi:hypothetical protein